MRVEWARDEIVKIILAALMPPNRLACEVSLATGWRIGDVLSLTTDSIRRAATNQGRISIQEAKTGKRSRRTLPKSLIDRLLAQAGTVYVFPGRLNGRCPRTRQAVYKDIRRVAAALRLGRHLGCHSMRKVYAVEQYHQAGGGKRGLDRVQALLNHSSEAITMIYALADELRTSVR